MSIKDTITAKQAADLLGCYVTYAYVLLQQRLIEGQRVDGKWFVSRRSVEQYKLRHPRVGRSRKQELQELSA